MRLVDLLITISRYPLQDQTWGDEVLKFVNIELPSDQQLMITATGDQVITHLRQYLGYDISNRILETTVEHRGTSITFATNPTPQTHIQPLIHETHVSPVTPHHPVEPHDSHDTPPKKMKVLDWVFLSVVIGIATFALVLMFTSTMRQSDLEDPETKSMVNGTVNVVVEFLKYLNSTSAEQGITEPTPYPERQYSPPPMECTEETMGYPGCTPTPPPSRSRDGLGL